jgi:hypothetical protein
METNWFPKSAPPFPSESGGADFIVASKKEISGGMNTSTYLKYFIQKKIID